MQPVLLAGPTAVGKSEVALRLAETLGGEIISVDSMQVYRGLDLGTAKPSTAARARVPHHLIDVVDITEPFDAAQFVRLARPILADLASRGRVAILCGGTGLYFKALFEGLGHAPPADAKLRAELESAPLAELLRELAARDPVTYERIDRQNPRRVVRAVEVIRLTGRPFSEQRAKWEAQMPGQGSGPLPSASEQPAASGEQGGSPTEPLAFGLTRSSSDLGRRIDARVEEMFRRGLVAETRELLKRGLEQNRTAMQALGYRQVVEFLHGQRSLPATIELVKVRTRQYSRRQMTWFRRQMHLRWRELKPQAGLEAVSQSIADEMRSPT